MIIEGKSRKVLPEPLSGGAWGFPFGVHLYCRHLGKYGKRDTKDWKSKELHFRKMPPQHFKFKSSEIISFVSETWIATDDVRCVGETHSVPGQHPPILKLHLLV